MSLRSLFLCAVLGSVLATGCASADASTPEASGDDGSSNDDLTGNVRQAQINALRLRVQKDFANAPSLKNYKLVFVVTKLNTDGSKAFIRARIMKRDATGRDSELTDQNLKESVYAPLMAEGVFDGPEVAAGLKKTGNSWSVIKGATLEAYVVGPTDVAWTDWDTQFGLPRSWLGIN